MKGVMVRLLLLCRKCKNCGTVNFSSSLAICRDVSTLSSLQWLRNGVIVETTSVSHGASQAPITYSPVSLENTGSYTCRGIFSDGNFTNAVPAGTLTVLSE